MTASTAVRPVSVDELTRAWHALQEGQFRRHQDQTGRRAGDATSRHPRWTPTEQVLPVVGCVGQAGASAVALSIATVAGPARVIECCTASAGGLTNAVTAELGTSQNGWSLGRRERVLIARSTRVYLGVDELPTPDDPSPATTMTVLDIGWELGQVLASGGWVRQALTSATTVVAVTTATIPGMRRLETALTLLGADRTLVAVVGPSRRRWPRHLAAAMGPQSRVSNDRGHVFPVPADKEIAVRGLDSAPLPSSLLSAANELLDHAGARENHQKGRPT